MTLIRVNLILFYLMLKGHSMTVKVLRTLTSGKTYKT